MIIAILNPKVLLSVAKTLHFQHLFAVFTEVNSAADVYPPRGGAVLQDELIKVGKLLGILQYKPCRLLIRGMPERTVPAGDGDIGSLTLQVLRGGHTTHHLVEQLAAVTAVNLDGQSQLAAHGLQTALAKVLHRRDVLLQWNVRNLFSFGCCRVAHLAERKVF